MWATRVRKSRPC
ncbi:hypothetical protein F383_14502 [Gossypium arboreum]|uniref:Uncharacterized protein n=1 Tax=Gossypium arboreum TaxID=29729 RepID=A0A0B0MCV4_GOSAR|nr:hypothetical protein F383_14502 [Gossypium arboreum]